MQKLMRYLRCAMEQYEMVAPGDRIAVGLSGGKDSVAMLSALARMRSFYPAPFSLYAITVDPCFNGKPTDYSNLERLCQGLDIPYEIRRTQLAEVIFDVRKERNPCSLCARMRRGILHDIAKAAGCNKIALGHHLDDVAETFLMNLFNGGTIACFMPVTYLSRKDITMIRPMIFARESDCTRVVRQEGFPIVPSGCPVDGSTERQDVKELLDMLEEKYGPVRQKILGALQRRALDGY